MFIDYTRQSFEDVARDVDAVLDTVGGETQSRSWNLIRKGGALATVDLGTELPNRTAVSRGIRASIIQTQMSAARLKELAGLSTTA